MRCDKATVYHHDGGVWRQLNVDMFYLSHVESSMVMFNKAIPGVSDGIGKEVLRTTMPFVAIDESGMDEWVADQMDQRRWRVVLHLNGRVEEFVCTKIEDGGSRRITRFLEEGGREWWTNLDYVCEPL